MKEQTLIRVFALLTFGLVLVAGAFAEGTQEETAQDVGVADVDTTVDFAEVQWTDINATTATTRVVLEAMGYETTSKIVSVPIAFLALSEDEIDVFLGDWEPSMSQISTSFFEEGTVVNYHTNLTGAKYTLAVPSYVADAGVTHFEDIADYADEFDSKIYGIESGNDGNILIQDMIDSDAFGLGEFTLVESSEAGMLAQVDALTQQNEWIVFLGWAPHPMNTVYDIGYLAGGDDYFGPDYGAAQVNTLTRVGYAEENPNLGEFFKNLEFTLIMEGQIMKAIADGMTARDAATEWLVENPEILTDWLDGVRSLDGRDALPVVRAELGID